MTKQIVSLVISKDELEGLVRLMKDEAGHQVILIHWEVDSRSDGGKDMIHTTSSMVLGIGKDEPVAHFQFV